MSYTESKWSMGNAGKLHQSIKQRDILTERRQKALEKNGLLKNVWKVDEHRKTKVKVTKKKHKMKYDINAYK